MNGLYYGADSGALNVILVSHRLDTLEGFRTLEGFIFGWPELTLYYLDEDHVVTVLRPGGAARLTQ